MEASNPRANFVATPDNTALVEKPLILTESTRLTLKRKLEKGKAKLNARRLQEKD